MDKKRLVTGLGLGILAIISIFWFNDFFFGLLCAVIITLAAIEWSSIIALNNVFRKGIHILILWWVMLFCHYHIQVVSYMMLCFWLLAFICLFVPFARLQFLKHKAVAIILGYLLLASTWAAIVSLHEHSRVVLFFLVMVVSFADTGAYYLGIRFGKHKLAPSLSPKKSIEGLLGGLVVGVLAGMLVVIFMPHVKGMAYLEWAIIAIVIVLVALVGDLFESLLKRLYGIKDSGHLLPGHGGVLDRIDSLLSSVPIFILICLWFNLIP